jgi:hypothetical protein
MSRSGPCCQLAFVLGLAVLATGCNPAVRAAEDLAAKNASARGGLEAWRAVKSMELSGTLEAGVPRDQLKLAETYLRARRQNKAETRRAELRKAETQPRKAQLPFVLDLKRPRDTRLEIRFQGQTAVQVYDGSHGWKVRPFLGRREVEPYSEEELRLASEQGDLDGPLIDAAKEGKKLELVGSEQVEGRDTFRIRITSGDGQRRNVWVDKETYLEARIDGTRTLDGKPRTVFTYFRDYRPVEGLLIPHTLETVVEGIVGTEKILIEHVALNVELADARFARPEVGTP